MNDSDILNSVYSKLYALADKLDSQRLYTRVCFLDDIIEVLNECLKEIDGEDGDL